MRSTAGENPKSEPSKGLRIADRPIAHHLPTDNRQTDPDLAAIIAAWPGLPVAIKAAITMLAETGGQE
jgi:hypothetical protein